MLNFIPVHPYGTIRIIIIGLVWLCCPGNIHEHTTIDGTQSSHIARPLFFFLLQDGKNRVWNTEQQPWFSAGVNKWRWPSMTQPVVKKHKHINNHTVTSGHYRVIVITPQLYWNLDWWSSSPINTAENWRVMEPKVAVQYSRPYFSHLKVKRINNGLAMRD